MPSPYPDTLGGCVKLLAHVKKKLDLAQAKVAPIEEEYKALREHLLQTFAKTDLNGCKGSGIAIAVVNSNVPSIADWDAFVTYARKKGNEDLLHRAVSAEAWRERLEAGVNVPGVNAFNRVSLRVTRVRSAT